MTQNLQDYSNLVGGGRVAAVSGEWIDSYNPYLGVPWARIPRCGEDDVDRAVAAAKAALKSPEWKGLTPT